MGLQAMYVETIGSESEVENKVEMIIESQVAESESD